LFAFAMTGLATLVLGNNIQFKPRPFFLNDATLWFEWYEQQSVPIAAVFIIGYAVLSPLIYFGEYNLARSVRRTSPRRAKLTALRFALGVWTSTMLGVCLVEFAKGYVGRLRPNFAQRCLGPNALPPVSQDSLARVITSDDGCVEGHGAWDGRRSFPSGHSALGAGLGVYAQLWIVRADAGVVGYIGGFLALGAGFGVGASRVADNAHHVGDVVAGALIGVWLAAVHFWMVERETAVAEAREAPAGLERGSENHVRTE
jgi:membrane-associated phospholipid phosphatase